MSLRPTGRAHLPYAVEVDEPVGRQWAADLHHVIGRAVRLHRECGGIRPATLANPRPRVEEVPERLIFGPPLGDGQTWKLQRHYRRHRADLFVLLHRADVERTNNSSEQDVRASVIHTKVTGECRSARGAKVTTHVVMPVA